MTGDARVGTDAGSDVPVGIDPARLDPWLVAHVDGLVGPLHYDLVAGGHSCLTYVVTDAAGRRIVVRRPPLGHVLATAHDVVREHRLISALGPTDVPVPPALAVCEDTSVNDAPFFVMGHVDGIVLHDAETAERSFTDASARRTAGFSMMDALAALHAVDIDAVGLGDLARRSGYLDRQLKRWSAQWEASRTRELPEMERLHEWLVRHRPDETRTGIVHGDFRLGNALLAPDGHVAAMLDWELCTLGPPMADLAYVLRSWVQPGETVSPHLVPPTTAGGFPDRDELVERYASRTGHGVTDLDYWMAFNAWRSAAINEGVLRRYLDGNMGAERDDLDDFRRGVGISVRSGLEHARRHHIDELVEDEGN